MSIIAVVIKSSVLLAAALLASRVHRRAPAARHALWSATFVALVTLPALVGLVPALAVPVPRNWTGPAPEPVAVATTITSLGAPLPSPKAARGVATTAPRPASVAAPSPLGSAPLASMAWSVWLAGAAAAACTLLLSLTRVRRLRRDAIDVGDPEWRASADRIAAKLSLRRPVRVLVSRGVHTPMAGGVWRPVIFLPPGATSWSAERRDVVLAHELAHVAGSDALRHLAARLAVGCYWFHPLAWLAARQASLAREQACDEVVLSLGIRASDYARVLLELADMIGSAPRAAAALPMVERSLLETRLMAILDPHARPTRRRPRILAAGAALFVLTVAAAQPMARDVAVRTPAATTPAAAVGTLAAVHDAVAMTAAAPQTRQAGDTTCWSGPNDSSTGVSVRSDGDATSFRGNVTGGGERTLHGDWVIQQRFADLRVCMAALDGTMKEHDGPAVWAARASRVVIETAGGGANVHFETRHQGTGTQTIWRVNGADRPFDAAAQAWRSAVVAVLDRSWEMSSLHGQESSLRGEIASLRGEESSLRGEIASARGDLSSLRGEQSSVRGLESSLRGEIASIEGAVSSLRGQIASERGAISSLEASRDDRDDADRQRLQAQLKAHEEAIARIERQLHDYDEAAKIAAVEREIRALGADAKVAALDDQIRAYNESAREAALQKQIQALNVAGRTAEIEKRIQALDVDRRFRDIENGRDEALKRLREALAAIR